MTEGTAALGMLQRALLGMPCKLDSLAGCRRDASLTAPVAPAAADTKPPPYSSPAASVDVLRPPLSPRGRHRAGTATATARGRGCAPRSAGRSPQDLAAQGACRGGMGKGNERAIQWGTRSQRGGGAAHDATATGRLPQRPGQSVCGPSPAELHQHYAQPTPPQPPTPRARPAPAPPAARPHHCGHSQPAPAAKRAPPAPAQAVAAAPRRLAARPCPPGRAARPPSAPRPGSTPSSRAQRCRRPCSAPGRAGCSSCSTWRTPPSRKAACPRPGR